MNNTELVNNIKTTYLKNNLLDSEELGLEDAENMGELWLESRPMPVVNDANHFEQAVNKSFWSLECIEASRAFYNKDYGLDTNAHRSEIEQAIINRDSDLSMLFAGLAYVEKITTE